MINPILSTSAIARWLPCQLDLANCQGLIAAPAHNTGESQASASMRTAVLHGTGDPGNGRKRVFAAPSSRISMAPGATGV